MFLCNRNKVSYYGKKNVPWHISAPAAVACDIRIVLRRSALLSVLQPFELLVYLMLLSFYLHVSSECNLFLFLKIIYNSVHVSECHAYNLRTYLIVVGIRFDNLFDFVDIERFLITPLTVKSTYYIRYGNYSLRFG